MSMTLQLMSTKLNSFARIRVYLDVQGPQSVSYVTGMICKTRDQRIKRSRVTGAAGTNTPHDRVGAVTWSFDGSL
jgi:hypothetical protein